MIEQLGPYKIVRILGRGGMGTVYEGVHEATGQRAAIKVLPESLADDGNFRERFMGEIETLKQLKHPNIVELFGDGEHDGLLFYAMELVDGRTLQEELQAKHPFDWPEVVKITVETCQALKHAHDHGIVHRDLKPANLLRTSSGEIKLLDFGIAKLFGATHLTADGSIVGTADYMSPEQAEGSPVTNRTDLFSLGAVMFTLLTRRPPFSGGSIPEVLHRLRYDDAPLVRQFAPSVPRELEEIIDQLLKKEPKDRLPTALVLSNRLRAMEHGLAAKTVVNDHSTAAGTPQVRSHEQPTRVSPVDRARATEISPTSIDPRTSSAGEGSYSWNEATVVTGGAESAEANVETPRPTAVTKSDSKNRFTTIEDERRKQTSVSPAVRDYMPILLIGVILIGLAGAVAWGLRTPSADVLYDRAAIAMRSAESREARTSIERFLDSYGDDPRSGEVRAWLLDIQSQYLFSRLRTRAKRAALTEAQTAYVEAMKRLELDPQAATQQFEELLSNHGDTPDEADPITCVEAARHQLRRLRERDEAADAADTTASATE